jgi:hypothetical protein
VVLCLVGWLLLVMAAGGAQLAVSYLGTPSPSARGTGHDAEWLGHAWVDGRKTQSDVDALAVALRGTGIRDLFVHSGPFRDDGTLDPALRPRARWLAGSLHVALPGVRVQAWLGAHPVPGQLRLGSATTRASVLTAVGQVLDVDQVAFMAYDTTLWTEATYGGYVRRTTEAALRAVPTDVALLIGVPAYHDENLRHHRRAETMRAALRGVRLALGTSPRSREFGVAIYVDFTVTTEDWATYRRDWA